MMHSTHFIYETKPAPTTSFTTLSNKQQGIFLMHHPTDRIADTTAFVTSVVELWLE